MTEAASSRTRLQSEDVWKQNVSLSMRATCPSGDFPILRVKAPLSHPVTESIEVPTDVWDISLQPVLVCLQVILPPIHAHVTTAHNALSQMIDAVLPMPDDLFLSLVWKVVVGVECLPYPIKTVKLMKDFQAVDVVARINGGDISGWHVVDSEASVKSSLYHALDRCL